MRGEEAIVISLMVIGSFWVLRPVAAAIAKRIAGEHRSPVPDPPQRDAIAAEVEQLRQEMTEMQERLDFAERLLAKQRGAERIGPGPD
ncbi:MAG: hypothetical protein AUH68_01680 [Gemmatimonadetes bacterium 13_1_40CM_4_69_5]|nr:MAG: hypothetical protein AUH68_01680 [Gemmatimonadetes bacterium 13_1_40CM_4_69_5]